MLAVLLRSSSLKSHGKHVKLLQQKNRMRVVERAQEKQDERVPYEKPLKLGLVSSSDDPSPSLCRHDFGECIYSFPCWGRRIKRSKHGLLTVFSSVVFDTF